MTTEEERRLRRLIWEIAECRMDTTVVHELAQQALGYDPDIEDHEVVHHWDGALGNFDHAAEIEAANNATSALASALMAKGANAMTVAGAFAAILAHIFMSHFPHEGTRRLFVTRVTDTMIYGGPVQRPTDAEWEAALLQ